MRCWFQNSDQLLLDLIRGKGFTDISGGAQFDRFPYLGLAAFGSDHHHRNLPPLRRSLNGSKKLKPVHPGHVDIAQHEVDFLGTEYYQRLLAITSFVDGV